MICILDFIMRRWAEKFRGWPRYFHGMWPNEVYTLFLLMFQFLDFMGQKVISSRYDVIMWTFQPLDFSTHSRKFISKRWHYILGLVLSAISDIYSLFWNIFSVDKEELLYSVKCKCTHTLIICYIHISHKEAEMWLLKCHSKMLSSGEIWT